MTDFNLGALIEQCWDAGPEASDIAAKVDPLIPESERHNVLLFLLTQHIARSKPRLTEVLAFPDRHERSRRPEPAAAQPKARAQRSASVAAIRDHARFLRLAVKVAPRESKWMQDCTYDDLIYAAGVRRDKAAQTVAAAEQYEALAELLRAQRVKTVGRLPKSALDAFLADWKKAA